MEGMTDLSQMHAACVADQSRFSNKQEHGQLIFIDKFAGPTLALIRASRHPGSLRGLECALCCEVEVHLIDAERRMAERLKYNFRSAKCA